MYGGEYTARNVSSTDHKIPPQTQGILVYMARLCSHVWLSESLDFKPDSANVSFAVFRGALSESHTWELF